MDCELYQKRLSIVQHRKESYIKKQWSDFYEYLLNLYPQNLSFQERIFWFLNNIKVHPICPVCGKETKFLGNHGYQKYCSIKCSANSNEVRSSFKKTMIEKYGVDNPSHSENILDWKKQNNIKKYGTPWANNVEKAKRTNIERYGRLNYSQTEECKNKVKQHMIEKYGVSSFSLYNSNYVDDEVIDGNLRKVKCPHSDCNKCDEKYYLVTSGILANRKQYNTELCTRLLPMYSYSSTTIEIFIRNILEKYNIEYISNDRSILSNHMELDIYIPSKQLAIECNGDFWHSSEFKSNNYHYSKWKECKELGIQLLTIWEDQIAHKPEIIESIILSKLGIYDRRLGARKCEIREVKSNESAYFLNLNHLQGSVNSKVRLGLYYNDELVSLMTFGSKRKCMGGKENQWELHRYCNKIGTQVVGGASRLFKHFIETYKPDSIESFSSNDISNGSLYKELGFEDSGSQYGSYWYIEPKNLTRLHRYNFRKDVLIREGCDLSKSEFQIMSDRGYYRIYDSGQTKWILKCS